MNLNCHTSSQVNNKLYNAVPHQNLTLLDSKLINLESTCPKTNTFPTILDKGLHGLGAIQPEYQKTITHDETTISNLETMIEKPDHEINNFSTQDKIVNSLSFPSETNSLKHCFDNFESFKIHHDLQNDSTNDLSRSSTNDSFTDNISTKAESDTKIENEKKSPKHLNSIQDESFSNKVLDELRKEVHKQDSSSQSLEELLRTENCKSKTNFVPNMLKNSSSWQNHMNNTNESLNSPNSMAHIFNDSNINNNLSFFIKSFRDMLNDLKDTQKNILLVQHSIIEAQNNFLEAANSFPKKTKGLNFNIPPSELRCSFSAFGNQNSNPVSQSSNSIDIADLIDNLQPTEALIAHDHILPPDVNSKLSDDPLFNYSYKTHSHRLKRSRISEEDDFSKSNENDENLEPIETVLDDTPYPGILYSKDQNSWVACWQETGRQTYKFFSNKRFGYERAKQLAINARIAFETKGLESDEIQDKSKSQDYFSIVSKFNIGENKDPITDPSKKTLLRSHVPVLKQNLNNPARNEYQQLAAAMVNPKGVCYAPSNNTWMAYGAHSSGIRMCKSFPVQKYGFYKARELAIETLGGDIKKYSEHSLPYEESLHELTKNEKHEDFLFDSTNENSKECVSLLKTEELSYNSESSECIGNLRSSENSLKAQHQSSLQLGYERSHELVQPPQSSFETSNEKETRDFNSFFTKEPYSKSTGGNDKYANLSTSKSTFNTTNSTHSVRHKSKHASEHVKGVNFNRQCNTWAAIWYVNGVQQVKYFSVKQFGFDEAKRLAIEHRKKIDAARSKSYKDRGEKSSKILNFNRNSNSLIKSNQNTIIRETSNEENPSKIESSVLLSNSTNNSKSNTSLNKSNSIINSNSQQWINFQDETTQTNTLDKVIALNIDSKDLFDESLFDIRDNQIFSLNSNIHQLKRPHWKKHKSNDEYSPQNILSDNDIATFI